MPLPLAAAPRGPVEVPPAVRALAAGAVVDPVWRNQLGGLTFRLTGTSGTRYVKWVATGTPELDLDAEAARLAWAGRYAVVPRVLGSGHDDDGSWLVTAGLAGRSAVDPAWLARPEAAARAIGAGLRSLHDALPVDECPFTWSVEERVARLDGSARGQVGPAPAIDRLVVCHGDACAPNTLVADDGAPAGHVDLGALGVADRWADLATASMSLGWNYGEGHEAAFFAAYGIAPDAERITFYRRLWNLG
ncbi:aminoglycoside 3'-phosphotransferase [Isoptericola sp. S6320L]|uniref:aminoglycoside 3'-phosphotransferase n=1 Tax=Isoptericola sp. S6320L TaxID=2926411 RepID=UPI001FF5F976|nr:aminoglycoside 3'-phosphotransferase [Isoptericola sp. S6320L]MCK0117980.1 aminoglycoside 3'-phosphotransferase [Isoptericola sp. S6320L]